MTSTAANPACDQAGPVLFNRDGPGDAADVGHQIIAQLSRQRFLQRDVAHRKSAARFQDAGNLAEDGPLVRGQVDDAIAR